MQIGISVKGGKRKEGKGVPERSPEGEESVPTKLKGKNLYRSMKKAAFLPKEDIHRNLIEKEDQEEVLKKEGSLKEKTTNGPGS